MAEQFEIDGVNLHVGQPDTSQGEWIGQQESLEASARLPGWWWMKKTCPLTPRLVGTPGNRQNHAGDCGGAGSAAVALTSTNATADTRPEDLLVTPVLGEQGTIKYHASPLVSAMLKGGICLLDEGNRNEREILGQPGPAFGSQAVRGIDRGGNHDPGSSRFPLCGDDERRRIHV